MQDREQQTCTVRRAGSSARDPAGKTTVFFPVSPERDAGNSNVAIAQGPLRETLQGKRNGSAKQEESCYSHPERNAVKPKDRCKYKQPGGRETFRLRYAALKVTKG